MVKVAILGVSGYGGSEVLRLLSRHDGVVVSHLGAGKAAGLALSQSLGHFYGIRDGILGQADLLDLASSNDCIIAATPHDYLASLLTKEVLDKAVVIDLSADFRLKNPAKYEEYYNFKHPNPALLEDSVYGLCELNRESIRAASLIANPGCYPTCSTLCVLPLLSKGVIDGSSLIIDAKSGVSGAGRGSKLDSHFCEVHENVRAYGLINHRHVAEIEQNLIAFGGVSARDLGFTFTPHVVPMSRGILVTAYAKLSSAYRSISPADLDSIYEEFCASKPFLRYLPGGLPPQTRWVRGSNFVDISVCLDSKNGRVVMMGALDNLVKGAAGAAIQNLNLRFGFEETRALEAIALFP